MEVKAQEIASLIDNPDYVCRNRTSIDAATDQVVLGRPASTR
jgi:hypothetical protein